MIKYIYPAQRVEGKFGNFVENITEQILSDVFTNNAYCNVQLSCKVLLLFIYAQLINNYCFVC